MIVVWIKPFAFHFCTTVLFGCAILFFSSCKSNEEWSVVFLEKGKEYASQKKWEPALSEYVKAATIAPENYRVHLVMAEANYQMNNCPDALENITQVTLKNPHIESSYYMIMAECIIRRYHDYSMAITSGYDPAIRYNSKNPSYYQKRAEAYQALGKQDLAQKDIQKAKELQAKL